MGLLIDTDVWVLAERASSAASRAKGGDQGKAGASKTAAQPAADRAAQLAEHLGRHAHLGGAFMSAVTASELLVGVERANTPERRATRAAFIEHLLAHVPVLAFDTATARTHARLLASLPAHVTAGAHDALIAATALHQGLSVLTRNVADFRIFAGLEVLGFEMA